MLPLKPIRWLVQSFSPYWSMSCFGTANDWVVVRPPMAHADGFSSVRVSVCGSVATMFVPTSVLESYCFRSDAGASHLLLLKSWEPLMKYRKPAPPSFVQGSSARLIE